MLDSKLLLIGRFVRPHALRGGVVLQLYNPLSKIFEKKGKVYLFCSKKANPKIEEVIKLCADRWFKLSNGRYIVFFDGVCCVGKAEQLRGLNVFTSRSGINTGEGEVFLADIYGGAVEDGGKIVGKVVGFYFNGAHDVAVIQLIGEKEKAKVDFPVISQYIEGFDAEAGILRVRNFEYFKEFSY